jgi:hypothetical protein
MALVGAMISALESGSAAEASAGADVLIGLVSAKSGALLLGGLPAAAGGEQGSKQSAARRLLDSLSRTMGAWRLAQLGFPAQRHGAPAPLRRPHFEAATAAGVEEIWPWLQGKTLSDLGNKTLVK